MNRLAIVGLIAGLTFVVLLFTVNWGLNSRAESDAQGDLASRADLLAESIDQMLQRRMVETLTFAALPSMRGYAASDVAAQAARLAVAQSELQSIVAADPNIRAALIADSMGFVNLATDDSIGEVWADRIVFKEGAAGHLYASAPSRDKGEFSQYYSAPILDNAGNVAGVLVVRVAAQELWGLVNAQPEAMVIDENGVRIADRSPSPQIFAALAPLTLEQRGRLMEDKFYGGELTQIGNAGIPALAKAIQQGAKGPVAFSDMKGVGHNAVVRRLKTKDWTVVSVAGEASRQEQSRVLLMSLAGYGLLAFLLGASAAYLVAPRSEKS